MPASFEIDIETLLQPISEEAPSGALLRYEGTYERIREARREDDASLPQGVWERALKAADWSAVASLSVDALTRKTKDLQIAVWLAEAWIQQGGVAGLRQGLLLCQGLCERFWDTLFPEIYEGSAEARVDLLDWLDDVASRKLRQIPLTEPSGAAPAFTLADWEAGLHMGAAGRGRGSGGEEPAPPVTHESFLARLSMTKYARWAAMKSELDDALAAAAALEEALASKVEGASAMRRTSAALRSVATIVEEGLKVTINDAPPAAVSAGGGSGLGGQGGHDRQGGEATPALPGPVGGQLGFSSGVGGGASGSAGGPITSRTDAYVRLTEAADYLLRTEPHSPVPYLVKRAISWGNMSLAELLYEFVGNTDDLVAIQRLLGMREKE
jgi:type VI secretion system protein ImpA